MGVLLFSCVTEHYSMSPGIDSTLGHQAAINRPPHNLEPVKRKADTYISQPDHIFHPQILFMNCIEGLVISRHEPSEDHEHN